MQKGFKKKHRLITIRLFLDFIEKKDLTKTSLAIAVRILGTFYCSKYYGYGLFDKKSLNQI